MTVELDLARVEARLIAGALACPGCGGVLRGWGWARPRWVRDLDRRRRLVPRRARCSGCAVTHVLLPVICLLRRADTAAVVGAALAARAGGQGHRAIAEMLDRPASTVRGWLRRVGSRLAGVEAFFTAAGVRLAADPVLPGASRSAWVDAVAAVVWFAGVAAERFGMSDPTGEANAGFGVWASATALCHGRLLAPSWPPPLRWSAQALSSTS